MSLTNEVRLVGFCAEKPELLQTKTGSEMAVLTVYTHDKTKKDEIITQAHRCVFFGKKAFYLCQKAEKGRHIHLSGSLRSQRKGEGINAHYYTSIIVEDFYLSPRQSTAALRDTVRDILNENHITSTEGLMLFEGDKSCG